ncbi:MAG: hypothetical protein CMD19_05225 [Flavobacteriales bacterium]|jgi:hypothetical protein|nr:hypothetical protein [Flavobacteriales bacterium]
MKKKIIGSILLSGMIFLSYTEALSQERSQERSINTYYNKMGIDNEGVQNIEDLLLGNGIEQRNIEVVKRCIIGIVKDIPNESLEFKLSDRNKNYLQEIGVKPSQIGVIKRIALRVSLSNSRREGR